MLSLTNCTDEELLADLRASLPIEHYQRIEAWLETHQEVEAMMLPPKDAKAEIAKLEGEIEELERALEAATV